MSLPPIYNQPERLFRETQSDAVAWTLFADARDTPAGSCRELFLYLHGADGSTIMLHSILYTDRPKYNIILTIFTN